MGEQFSLAMFSSYVHSTFRVNPDGPQVVDLELVAAIDHGATPRQVQFALHFKGPLGMFLPQQTYPMEHDQLGRLELFLVPIGKDEQGFTYEAYFNLLIDQA